MLDTSKSWETVTFMRALIIKQPWIDKILTGDKTWEIRGSATKVRGQIWLIQSGTGQIVGSCELADCRGPLSHKDMLANQPKHQIPPESLADGLPYKKTYAWVMKEARRLDEPVWYEHLPGAAVWVNLTDGNVEGGVAKLNERD